MHSCNPNNHRPMKPRMGLLQIWRRNCWPIQKEKGYAVCSFLKRYVHHLDLDEWRLHSLIVSEYLHSIFGKYWELWWQNVSLAARFWSIVRFSKTLSSRKTIGVSKLLMYWDFLKGVFGAFSMGEAGFKALNLLLERIFMVSMTRSFLFPFGGITALRLISFF